MSALKLIRASAMQIQAISGYGCDCSFLVEKIVEAIKRRPITERVNRPAKINRSISTSFWSNFAL